MMTLLRLSILGVLFLGLMATPVAAQGDIPTHTPVLDYPMDGQTLHGEKSPVFNWSPQSDTETRDGEATAYRVIIRNSANQVMVSKKVQAATACQPIKGCYYDLENDNIKLPYGTYTWRVKALYPTAKPASEVFTFTLKAFKKPKLIFPAEGQVLRQHPANYQFSYPATQYVSSIRVQLIRTDENTVIRDQTYTPDEICQSGVCDVWGVTLAADERAVKAIKYHWIVTLNGPSDLISRKRVDFKLKIQPSISTPEN